MKLFRDVYNESIADFIPVAQSILSDVQGDFYSCSRLWSKYCNIEELDPSYDSYCQFVKALRESAKTGVSNIKNLLQNTLRNITEDAFNAYKEDLLTVLANFVEFISERPLNTKRLNCYLVHYRRVSERIEGEVIISVRDYLENLEDKLTPKSVYDVNFYTQTVVDKSESCFDTDNVLDCLNNIVR